MKGLLIAAILPLAHAAQSGEPELRIPEVKTIVAEAKVKARKADAARREDAVQAGEVEAALIRCADQPGFSKFLAIKEVVYGKTAETSEGKAPALTPKAAQALLSGFEIWERRETPSLAAGCGGPGDSCSSSIWCCGATVCRGGVCGGGGSQCIPRGRRCGGTIWCCGDGICNDHAYCQ